jgi:hypothetical protein
MISKKINCNKKLQIENMDYLSILMKDFKAILAGGSAYTLFHEGTISGHLKKHTSADIDLYFPSESDYNNAVEFLTQACNSLNTDSFIKSASVELSVTGLCHNFLFSKQKNSKSGMALPDFLKYQLVGVMFDTPANVISSFDFKNLEVCYYYDDSSKSYVCLSSKNTKNRTLLDIRHTRSPFLMHRVYKYLTYRGFTGVTESSRQHISEWIIKASSGFYDENTDMCPSIYVNLIDNYGLRTLLKKTDVIGDDDLVYMIGKIKEKEFEINRYIDNRGYHQADFKQIGTKDIIIEEMKKRSSNESK